jgi:predicted enzyme related to lactoylglutathione lyase
MTTALTISFRPPVVDRDRAPASRPSMPFARWRRHLVTVAAALCAHMAMADAVSPAASARHVGKVAFVELVTPDLATAEQFYGGLFGWRFNEPAADAQYVEASLDGLPVAGLVHKALRPGEQRQPAWLGFIAVQDVDVVTKLALLQGAKVLSAPHDIPGRGREAVFADPQGAVFAVLAPSNGGPPDVLPDFGEWIWSSLLTRDLDTGAAFYQTLFGYEVFELPEGGGRRHVIFASDNFARASANAIPPTSSSGRPRWINYIRVADASKAVERAVALGGRVLVQPRDDRHGGKVAVVADPQGAPFGLLEWPDTDGPKGAP